MTNNHDPFLTAIH